MFDDPLIETHKREVIRIFLVKEMMKEIIFLYFFFKKKSKEMKNDKIKE